MKERSNTESKKGVPREMSIDGQKTPYRKRKEAHI